jgi:hypothetical protein
MTLLWKDYRFQWNMNYANVSSTFVDMNWIWIPDVTLYNAAGDSNIIDAPAQVYHDGSVRLRRLAFLSAYCGMNIKKFPFDTQKCTLDFASWAGHLAVTAAPKQMRPIKNNLISPQAVVSISYNLDSFTTENTLKDEGGMQKNWPFVVYTLKVTRHSKFYTSTTIMPIVIVTIICVAGLWIPDINARLGLTVTSLLTVMAINWSVTSSLPISNDSTWIQDFSNFCTMIIGFCCLENAMVAYFQSKAGIPPRWVKRFIDFSNFFSRIYDRVFLYFVDNCCDWFCNIYKLFYKVPKRRRYKHELAKEIELNNQQSVVSDVESVAVSQVGINNRKNSDDEYDDNDINNNGEDIINPEGIIDNDNRITITPTIINPLQTMDDDITQVNNSTNNNNETVNEEKHDDNNNEDNPLIRKIEKDVTWERFGRSFDRFMRFLLPLTLMIGFFSYFESV